MTLTGIVSGGALRKGGAGTLVLTGTNTYSGGTKVAGGTLSIGADTALGTAGTGVGLAGGGLHVSETFATSRPFALTTTDSDPFIDVDSAKTLTLNGIVSGGALDKEGAGTLVLNGANTYAKTTIAGGVLVGNAKSIGGDISFEPADTPVSVTFDQRFDGTFGGAITGAGSLLKTNRGALTLKGDNTYSGGTTVENGSLVGTS